MTKDEFDQLVPGTVIMQNSLTPIGNVCTVYKIEEFQKQGEARTYFKSCTVTIIYSSHNPSIIGKKRLFYTIIIILVIFNSMTCR